VNFLSAFELAVLNVRPVAGSDEGWRGGCSLGGNSLGARQKMTLAGMGKAAARGAAGLAVIATVAACTGGTPEAGRISSDTVSAGSAAGGISGAPAPAYVDTGGSALNPGGVVPTDTAHQRQTNMGPGRPQAPATTPPAPGTTPTP
jgi:hypothetical protein